MGNLLQHARRAITWPGQPEMDSFSFGGNTYFGVASTAGVSNTETITGDFVGLVDGAFKRNPIVFACELKRLAIFSEARFIYRRFNKGRPGRLFSDPSLDILEHPWPRGTTGDLLARMILSADLAGNAYVARALDEPDRLRVLRPDWVTIVLGDRNGRPVETAAQLDAEIIGFIYDPKDGQTDPEALLVDEVAHFAPIPDPLARFRGMSWLQPIVREVLGDQAAAEHKLAFFANGATPQTVVTFPESVNETAFQRFVAKMDAGHQGWQNAYKTLYLGAGADVTVVGKDLQQLDFSNTQGKGETRIAAAAGIHPVLIPLSEGLQGSSLNAGNYAAARRSTADTTFRPLWRNACGSLAAIIPPPGGAELWHDEAGVAFLREDAADRATVQFVKAQTIKQLVEAGFEPSSVVASVEAEDDSLLVHSGMLSVQLQEPGQQQPALNGNGGGLPALNGSGRQPAAAITK
jgi:phage portal protein BeeE